MRILIALVVLCLCIGYAGAATVSYSASAPAQYTFWNQTLALQKFDASLGNLESVTFQLTGHVEGTASFESLDAEPATVKTNLSAVIVLLRSDNTTIVTATPSVAHTDDVSAYDGITDLGGTSGRDRPSLSATKVESLYLSANSNDLSPYVGPGTFSVTATATGNSKGSGAGNLVLLFRTAASAVATVTYEYTPVPEPSSLLTMALGALGLAGCIKYRRR